MNCEKLNEIKTIINEKITRIALKVCIEVGVSSWLTKFLIKKHGFSLDSLSVIAYTSHIIFNYNNTIISCLQSCNEA